MTTEVLGTLSFIDTPTVAGQPVLLNAGGVPSLNSGTFAARPAAGNVGVLYVDTTSNLLWRDNGTTWDLISATTTYTGTANEIDVAGSVISIADNPILPGTGRVNLPTGTTAQRPGTPVTGDARFNTTLGWTEEYNGVAWSPMGRVLQVVTGNISSSTGSTQMVWDNTVPTATEGHQIWTTSFTPLLATSRIIIEFTITVASSTNPRVVVAQVRYGANCIGAIGQNMTTTNNAANSLALRLVYSPGSVATATISARAGMTNSGTLSVNQAGGNNLGGAAVTQYTITEVA